MAKRIIDYVNTFIGTAGSGHALVGPQMPHGMVKLSPDTISLPCGGYDYNDPQIIGFSHTHLEGVGGSGGRGNILLTATTGELIIDEEKYASKFSHEKEYAEVGYYQVVLEDYGINAELTATNHAGFHRYTFPSTDKGNILIDIGHTLGRRNNCSDGYITIIDDKTIQGYGVYPISPGKTSTFTVYFHIEFDKPFSEYGIWEGQEIFQKERKAKGKKVGAYASYSMKDREAVQVKVGISYISVKQAKNNLDREIPHWGFESIKNQNQNEWEKLLSRIKVKGGSKSQRIQFYSALYRALNQPTDYTEYDFYHSGYSGKAEVHHSNGYHFYGDDWALWDTFRTTHPLQTIIEPERQNDMAQTLVNIYQQGGWLPMATGPNLGYNQTMIGHNAASVICGIYNRGFRGFDLEKAYEAMKKTAMEQHNDPTMRRLGTPKLYKNLGYYPGGDEDTEEDVFSVSLTLELVYADWCTAQMAKALGKTNEYNYFMERAANYRKLFDPEVRFMRPRHRDGSWVEPFNPADSFKNGFCECSSWEYTFFVPHDIQGLINLIGGREAFIKRLDQFFGGGHYNYENETSIQVPFLYNYAGAPWKTQEIVRYYMTNKYKEAPDGLFGEDDAGAMSAWYVFAALGIYPVCPAQEVYVISSPVFEEVEIEVNQGKVFRIYAENASKDNIYIQSVFLNGEYWNKPWISYHDIVKGGELRLVLSNQPNVKWGSSEDMRPPSMTNDVPKLRYEHAQISMNHTILDAGETFLLECMVKNEGADGGKTIKIYANEEQIASKEVSLHSGDIKKVQIKCRLYKPGKYSIKIDDLHLKEVVVKDIERAIIEYEGKTKVSKTMIPYGSDGWIKAEAWIKNAGSREGKEKVTLYLNGKETKIQEVILQPGERKRVEFDLELRLSGIHEIQIGETIAGKVDVAIHPQSDWRTLSTTQAKYYQAGNHLYIIAAGYQNRPEYGILYRNQKVEGDFIAITKVIEEENTSPYAPAGIMVKNNIMDMEDRTGYVIVGAMSKRGYFFNCNTPIDNYYQHPKYAVGCPEVPYWFKLERKGNVFAGYYSKDGQDWVLLNKALVTDANKSLYVGLFVNSASPEMRKVGFEFFKITLL